VKYVSLSDVTKNRGIGYYCAVMDHQLLRLLLKLLRQVPKEYSDPSSTDGVGGRDYGVLTKPICGSMFFFWGGGGGVGKEIWLCERGLHRPGV
jgi:hypothetical protein